MMRTIEKTFYQYSELSENAKEKARAWYRRACQGDNYFSEFVIEDAENIGGMLGIEFDKSRNGKEAAIYWSGFSSQGDGASFHGRYSYKKGAANAIREYAPEDNELHRIAHGLQAIQARYFYGLHASITAGALSNHYSHSGTMAVSVECDKREVSRDAEDTVTQLMRDYADWIYSQLEAEYDYQNSDSSIAETIESNGYEFDSEGGKA